MILTTQANQKSAIFVTIGIFLDKGSNFQPGVLNGCHDVLMMSMNLSNIAIINFHHADYRCMISGIRKIEAINLIQNVNLSKKSGTL